MQGLKIRKIPMESNVENKNTYSREKIDSIVDDLYSKAYIMTTTIDIRTDNIIEPKEMLMFLPIYCGSYVDVLNKKYKHSDRKINGDINKLNQPYLSNKTINENETTVLNIKYNDFIRGIPKTFTGMKNTAILRIISNGKPATINIGGNNIHICGSKSEDEAKKIVSSFTKICTNITEKLIVLKLSDVLNKNRHLLSNPELLVETIFNWRCEWYEWIHKVLIPILNKIASDSDSGSNSNSNNNERLKYKNENIILDFMNKHEEIILLPSEYKTLIESSPDETCADYLLCFLPEFSKTEIKLYIRFLHRVIFVSNINTKYGFIYYTTYLISILQLCQDLFSNVKFPSKKYSMPKYNISKTEINRLKDSIHLNIITKELNVKNYGINIVKYRSTLFRCKYNVSFMINKTKLFKVINEKEKDFRVLNFQDNQQSKITVYLPIEDYSYDFIRINNDLTNDESSTKKQKKHNIRRHAFEISHDGIINQSSPSKDLGEYACRTMIHLLFKYYEEIKL